MQKYIEKFYNAKIAVLKEYIRIKSIKIIENEQIFAKIVIII